MEATKSRRRQPGSPPAPAQAPPQWPDPAATEPEPVRGVCTFFGCMTNHLRGAAICANTLEVPLLDTDAAVLDAIEQISSGSRSSRPRSRRPSTRCGLPATTRSERPRSVTNRVGLTPRSPGSRRRSRPVGISRPSSRPSASGSAAAVRSRRRSWRSGARRSRSGRSKTC